MSKHSSVDKSLYVHTYGLASPFDSGVQYWKHHKTVTICICILKSSQILILQQLVIAWLLNSDSNTIKGDLHLDEKI
jgi:hypothetical protein